VPQANVEFPVRVTQILAILITVATQQDMHISMNLLYGGFNTDLQRAFPTATRAKWLFAIILRFLGGCLGLGITFFLIVSAETVIDVLLNFTAMEFVSQLDEVAFYLAEQGFVGSSNQSVALQCAETTYDSRSTSRVLRRSLLLFFMLVVVLIAWGFVTKEQQSGKYLCQTLYVQFDDALVPSLGTFSGFYDLSVSESRGFLSSAHVKYVERRSRGRAAFGYCKSSQTWTLTYREPEFNDESDIEETDPCNWRAQSSKTISFDLTTTASDEWRARDAEGTTQAMQHFLLVCYDCSDVFCGDNGSCGQTIDTNKCQCDEGYYGLRCEFQDPCSVLTTDERTEVFLGTREWSSSYEILRQSNGNLVEAYSRPVFVSEYSEGLYDIILYTGRRWVVTYSDFLSEVTSKESLTEFLLHVHGYFSDLKVAFISEPMDQDTPQDAATPLGLSFFASSDQGTSNRTVQSADLARPSGAVLLCGICRNDTNPCFYDGICIDGACKCSLGAFGTLCQIPPVGNGHCDPFYNTKEFSYDSGDCCADECVSGDGFMCGKDASGFVHRGYFSCHTDEYGWKPTSPIGMAGVSLALSGNGAVLAIGNPANNAVQIFDRDGSEWKKRNSFVGYDDFGYAISMGMEAANGVSNPMSVPSLLLVAIDLRATRTHYKIVSCKQAACHTFQTGEIFVDFSLTSVRSVHMSASANGMLVSGGFYAGWKNDWKLRRYSRALPDYEVSLEAVFISLLPT
jgi:hypothetical protein